MRRLTIQSLILTAIAFLLLASAPVASAPAKSQAVKGAFLYTLSNFTGVIPYSWGRVTVDRERNEVYLLYQNLVKVFNESGMEIYRFGDDLDIGQIVDVAIDREGNILLLAYRTIEGQPKGSVYLCNYRGEVASKIELKGLPEKFSEFFPNRMVYRNGNLYFISLLGLLVVVTDSEGNFKNAYDLFSILELEEKDRGNVEVSGFSVDAKGNILFTIPVLFKAYVLSPDGKLNWFGKPGGAPGRFNVVAGIVEDSKGNYVIADKLKCAVLVFDKKFNFLTEFGYRGFRPENLIVPDDIAIDKNDRIYVTQARKRGVSVFKLTYN